MAIKGSTGSWNGDSSDLRSSAQSSADALLKAQTAQPKKKTKVEQLDERAGELQSTFMDRARGAEAPTMQRVNPKQVVSDRVVPGQVKGQQIGPVQGMSQLESAQNVAARNAQVAGQMDPRMQQFLQAAQQSGQYSPEAIGLMQQAAQGQGPSAAQAQMQAGTDQAIRAQLAAAGSRGFNPAAMRGAQMQGAEMLQTSANQAAQLRAQEQQAAQQQFLQASLQQEQMQRQAAMQAAGLTLDQDVASQQARQAAINAQGQIAGQLAGLGSQQAISQAELLQQANLANQQANLQAGAANQEAALRAALANQQAGIQAGAMNNEQALAAWQAGQQAQMGWSGLGADVFGQRLSAFTGLEQGVRQRNFQRDMADQQFKREMVGALIGAGGSAGAAYLGRPPASDKAAKKNIKPNDQTMAFLEALTDNSYDYKEPSKPGRAPGRHYGPMAQDLEKTPMGKTVVIKDQDGTKMVDSSRGFLLALSGLANVHQRLKALEA